MKAFEYIIQDELGIHARPAGMLVKEAKKYESTIVMEDGDKKTNLTQLIGIMTMGVKTGHKVTVSIEGVDEDKACKELQTFFIKNL